MTTVRFTSDLHFGHRKVSEIRGFDHVEDHDETILDNLYGTLDRGDSLWILGDLSSGGSVGQRLALTYLAQLVADLKITLHLVPGNHDGVHPMHRNSLKWDEEYRAVFASVQPFARRKIEGTYVWLSHFPWRGGGDHTEDERFPVVRLGDDGTSWLLHGHTHSDVAIDRDKRMVNVGLDAWDLAPIPIERVRQDIAAGSMEAPRIVPPRPRLKSCIEEWPECVDGEYNPSCCRFPKTCSCTGYSDNIDPALLEYPLPYEHTLAAWLERD